MIRLNRKGFTLVEIMIVVAIIALLAAIAIPNLLRARINANEAAAQATLKSYATACETFATANSGAYPALEANLTAPAAGAPYFPIAMNAVNKGGYTYAVVVAVGGYTVTATANSAQTGNWDYQITTGAVLGRRAQGTEGDYVAW